MAGSKEEEVKNKPVLSHHMDEFVRVEVEKSMNEKLDISLFSDAMKGGWEQEHVHKSVQDKPIFKEVPQKVYDPIPVLNRSAEPIVVEYNPDEEEDEKVVDIFLKATMV